MKQESRVNPYGYIRDGSGRVHLFTKDLEQLEIDHVRTNSWTHPELRRKIQVTIQRGEVAPPLAFSVLGFEISGIDYSVTRQSRHSLPETYWGIDGTKESVGVAPGQKLRVFNALEQKNRQLWFEVEAFDPMQKGSA